jgi:hypothetical protein
VLLVNASWGKGNRHHRLFALSLWMRNARLHSRKWFAKKASVRSIAFGAPVPETLRDAPVRESALTGESLAVEKADTH